MDLIDLALFIAPPYPIEQSLEMAKRLWKAIGDRSFSLVETQKHLAAADRDDAFEKNISQLMTDRQLGGECQILYMGSYLHGAWAQLKASLGVVPFERRGVETAWRLLTNTASEAIRALDPQFAVINGIGDVGSIYKNPIEPGELPVQWTPWVYLGPAVLGGGRRSAIEKLPATVRKEGDGLVVEAVPDLYSKPAAGFVEALAALPSARPIKYKQSKPPK